MEMFVFMSWSSKKFCLFRLISGLVCKDLDSKAIRTNKAVLVMGDDQFVWSVKNGDLATVKEFVEKGVDVNAQINGRLPMHYAADYGQGEVIEYLLSKGAKINEPDKFGITPLLSAIFEGHKECVRILIKKGADKSGKSPDGAAYIDCTDDKEIQELLK